MIYVACAKCRVLFDDVEPDCPQCHGTLVFDLRDQWPRYQAVLVEPNMRLE